MRWKSVVGISGVAIALVTAGCSAAPTSGNASKDGGDSVSVALRLVDGVGLTLVDQAGDTLYYADQERDGVVHCFDACVHFWVPIMVASGATPRAAASLAGDLSTINRPDGMVQVAYDGKPLYRFTQDEGPGRLRGNGVTDTFDGLEFRWRVATADGVGAP